MRATLLLHTTLVIMTVTCSFLSPLRGSSAMFGRADPMAVDQPRVAVELSTTDTLQSLGPDYGNTFLLDTGAQGLMAVGYAVTELDANGYQIDGSFLEIGIGGVRAFDLSSVYDFHFAGSDGQRFTIHDARIISDENLNFGGFSGIVGTPAMVNRVTSLDMTALLGSGEWFEFGYMGVAFDDTLPAPAGTRYTVRVDMVDFPPLEQPDPEGPLPTYGPLPFSPVRLQHTSHRAGGMFVLDTGAQISLISTELALGLGLDTSGDGCIWDEAIGSTTFTGIAGEVEVPIVAIDKLIIPTAEGVDLIWTDLQLPVYDVHPAIPGILGSDLLTTGWFRAVFETREAGVFNAVHFDFRDTDAATMLVDVNDAYEFLVTTNAGPGDANADGKVDLEDFMILKQNFGVSPAAWRDGDFTADGRVDLDDFVILKQQFGTGIIPEPSAAALLAVGALAAVRRHRLSV